VCFRERPLQIVRAMQNIAFGVDSLRFRSTRSGLRANALKFEGVALAVTGDSDEELAVSLVDEMVRAGLTTRL
jgi:hypothetical protein